MYGKDICLDTTGAPSLINCTAREKYFDLINNPKKVEKLLKEGEAKALKIASKNLKEIRSLVGIKSL